MQDFSDVVKQYMDGKFDDKIGDIYTSINALGQNVMVHITKDCLIITTFQNNGWARANYYYKDGTTCETYSK